jgi:hypothetical protein
MPISLLFLSFTYVCTCDLHETTGFTLFDGCVNACLYVCVCVLPVLPACDNDLDVTPGSLTALQQSSEHHVHLMPRGSDLSFVARDVTYESESLKIRI